MIPPRTRIWVVADSDANDWDKALAALQDDRKDLPWPPALSHVAALFDLTQAEGDLLLAAVAAELDPAAHAAPSFRTGLARGLPWQAIAAHAPLRRWRLLRPAGSGPFADRP